MEILTGKQIYEVDKATLKSQNITSLELIERAGTVCFNWIHSKLKGNPVKILIFCGIGNNGGIGLIMARHLHQHGYNVQCYVVNFSKKRTEGFLSNFEKLKDAGVWPTIINSTDDFPVITPQDVVIDAIIGIGISRKIQGFTVDLIKHINKPKSYTLSIDIPTGLFPDKSFMKGTSIIEASHTLTFQRPKITLLLPENEPYIYTWEAIDIGLDEAYIASMKKINNFIIEKEDVQEIYMPRNKFTHKGTYGHSLIIGGNHGKIGSVTLAAKAALKVGSGLVTALIPKCGYEILQISVPEVMVEVDAENELEGFDYETNPTVIGIGVGIGTSKKTAIGFAKFLRTNQLPLVIDADAINIIARDKELLKFIPENSILTPHPKEFERLFGNWKNDFDKLKKLKELTTNHKFIVVLKGANTVIAQGENMYFNTTGNPALSSAGTGDVLTGMITGLLAQGYTPLNAAVMGVYLHGKTADLAVQSTGVESFTASMIFNYIGKSYLDLFTEEKSLSIKKPSQPEPEDSEDDEIYV